MNRQRRRRRARIRRALLAGPPLVILAGYLVGGRLPPVSRVGAETSFPASAEAVWTVLTDLDDMPAWRGDVSALERLPERDGAVRWLEVGRRGRIAYQRVEADPPARLVVREERGALAAQWTYRITPTDRGIALAVVVERPVPGPFRRLAAAVFRPGRSAVDGFIADLSARLAARRREVVAGGGGRAGGR